MALQVIHDNEGTIDAIATAAAILLGPNQRRISARTYTCLLKHARRLAIVRGPVVDLLRLSSPSGPSSTRNEK
jgi:hypothetical protein